MIKSFLNNQQSGKSRNLKKSEKLITNEILKMFMHKTSLNTLTYELEDIYSEIKIPNNITLINFPGARDCLKGLSELSCTNDVNSKFFIQLSQVCKNIQTLKILYQVNPVSNDDGLKKLISSQNSLKHFSVNQLYDGINWKEIVPSLKKHSNTITKLYIRGINNWKPLSFITEFTNLQELLLSIDYGEERFGIEICYF